MVSDFDHAALDDLLNQQLAELSDDSPSFAFEIDDTEPEGDVVGSLARLLLSIVEAEEPADIEDP